MKEKGSIKLTGEDIVNLSTLQDDQFGSILDQIPMGDIDRFQSSRDSVYSTTSMAEFMQENPNYSVQI